jgi:hypothetical protein
MTQARLIGENEAVSPEMGGLIRVSLAKPPRKLPDYLIASRLPAFKPEE